MTADTHGAIRSEVTDALEFDADNPSDVQRKVIEEQQRREEQLRKQLTETGQ